MNQRFLDRQVTVRKTDNSWVKGICVNQDDLGLTIKVEREPNKAITIPYSQISEIVTSGENHVNR